MTDDGSDDVCGRTHGGALAEEGSTGTRTSGLVVVRGNSGSGKSTTARRVRERYGRGIAWVEQDHFRRIVLRERDAPGGANIGLIDQTVRYALDHGYHVLLEGILYADHYGPMLEGLWRDHRGRTRFYYFDLPFSETARRHATRPMAAEVTLDQMREWYQPSDLLGFVHERTIGADAELEDTVGMVLAEFLETEGATEPASAERGAVTGGFQRQLK